MIFLFDFFFFFFEKKGPKIFTTPYSIPFLNVLHQNKVLYNFHKRRQHSIVKCKKVWISAALAKKPYISEDGYKLEIKKSTVYHKVNWNQLIQFEKINDALIFVFLFIKLSLYWENVESNFKKLHQYFLTNDILSIHHLSV